MGISKRHHYIPQFLIKRFADKDNMLYLYDKEKQAFAKEKRSPKSVFFEMNRNTWYFEGTPNDNMEKLYAELDEKFSKDIVEISRTGIITEEALTSILVMASSMKWRLPSNDDLFDAKHKEYPYDKLPINIVIKREDGSDHKEALEYLMNSELFKQTKKLIFPFLPFYDNLNISKEKLLQVHRNSYVNTNPNIKSILGDAPLIESDTNNLEDFGNFILPLSSSETFICNDSQTKRVQNIAFYLNKDLAMFHQAKKYVVSNDIEYLKQIIDAYSQLQANGQVEIISRYLFRLA
ncbi:DUF4238 domain-containing protein [Chryseobacterium lactis]|uniref:DUF4238 domain-containing protein n=2 Tax=Bacteroidota TaxID=976 RepID=A0A4U9VIP1_9SPHI|nr:MULTISPECIES: DUF4238 domain-containing protein [Bacteroidota]OJV55597.1 MAG: hypothetical protein BGO31_19795 [Bacteroidetes bacterium 43-16]AZA84031.1 DUF4238 domain-containing protein [Chryseobacterium lactis]AZB04417.1 DUF4238 domain-containing protein [Chryseobacterium lactis]MCT3745569.1 DUF4238 domain-containing protein [Elizabethkingia anophelis]MDC8027078.1 DUF4238 domain-containing protein [Elizabethkingia anophelis]